MFVWIIKKFIFVVLFLSFGSIYAGDVQHIDNQELKELMLNNVPMIDVRTTSEWKETGIVEGSHLLMFYDEKGKYDLEKWLADVAAVAKKDQPLILICHSGSRSKQLAKYLNKVEGYEKVYNVRKGIVRWIKDDNLTVAP